MDQGPRYAIYFVPAEETPFYGFGSAALGYDCYTGKAVKHPEEFGDDLESWRRITAAPRRYGFHASLKAPFNLSSSCTEAQLASAVNSFAGLGYAIPEISPVIETLGDFAAVVPREASAALNALAANCTTLFDAFRAPMSSRERGRRVALGLSQSQIENLDRWGHPYLFADFRFHMTLTGKVAAGRRDRIVAVLRQCLRRMHAPRSIRVDRLALVRQDSSRASFRVLSHVALRDVQ